MSHFTLLVLLKSGQDLRTVLAPFDEGLETAPRIITAREEFIKGAREDYKDIPEIYDLSDDEFLTVVREDFQLDEKGNEISTYNEQSKWDGWVVGGRWSDQLRLTEEAYSIYLQENESRLSGKNVDSIVLSASGLKPEYCNAAKIKYLDFSPDLELYKKKIRFWELRVEGAEPQNEDEKESISWAHYKPEFYTKRFETKENYAALESGFTTWAVLTPDGKWHQQGNMGWWATSDETDDEAVAWMRNYKEKFIDTADPEWVAVVIDCHI